MAHEQIKALRARRQQSIIGQESVVEHIIIGLLANGNLLVEGFPLPILPVIVNCITAEIPS